MKRLILAGLGALAVVTTMGSANAADMPPRQTEMPVKAPLYEPPFSWTGFYIGINGGGGFGRSDFSAPFPTGSFNTSGGLVGGTLGYNYQTGNIVLGAEGDIDWSDIHGSAACAGTSCETRNNWLGTARGRLGYTFGNFMPYVTGGLAVGDINTSIAGVGDASQTKAGWTAGGGIEAHISGPWSAKVEYLHVDLGRGASVLGSDAKFQTDLVRAGLNYKF
jgi:outer membrane immunogenic protein